MTKVALFSGWQGYLMMVANLLESGSEPAATWARLELRRIGDELNKLSPMPGASEQPMTDEELNDLIKRMERCVGREMKR